MEKEKIITHLPYQEPFLFVEEILSIDEQSVEGCYTFKKDAYFYRGHFKDHPVTPGVILTETMAQIGLVCLGIYLGASTHSDGASQIALTAQQVDFFIPVYPGERVVVKAEKIYYRFQKLKCKVRMYNASNALVCAGEIAGMISTTKHKLP